MANERSGNVQSSLFPEVDLKQTAARVRMFFDRQLDHYLGLAGKHRADLKSPTSDGQPTGSPIGNPTENRMLKIWVADQVIECVGLAIKNCSAISAKLLLGKYADNQTNYSIAEELNSSSSTFTRDQLWALNEFADRFEYQLCKHHLDDEIKDLHVYQQNENGPIVG